MYLWYFLLFTELNFDRNWCRKSMLKFWKIEFKNLHFRPLHPTQSGWSSCLGQVGSHLHLLNSIYWDEICLDFFCWYPELTFCRFGLVRFGLIWFRYRHIDHCEGPVTISSLHNFLGFNLFCLHSGSLWWLIAKHFWCVLLAFVFCLVRFSLARVGSKVSYALQIDSRRTLIRRLWSPRCSME